MKHNVRSFVLLACFFLPLSFLHAQSPNDYINPLNVNLQYLEHLVKIKIDSVREDHDLTPLYNDSILYVAAKDHAEYLKRERLTGHYQKQFPDKETPAKRVEYYGGKNYRVGENAISIYVLVPTRYKHKKGKDKPHTAETYNQAANDMVIGWVNSPGHFTNIITPTWQITGMALEFDEKSKNIKGVQKFAFVPGKYSFADNTRLFPYSEDIKIVPPADFGDISTNQQNLKKQSFPWEIKYTDSEKKCKDCFLEPEENKRIKLVFEPEDKLLRFFTDDVELAKQLFKKKKDGAALEIVEYQPFDCGNPQYYSVASRRNKKSIFNGKVLKPIYKKDIFASWKKQAKKFKTQKKERLADAKKNGASKAELSAIKTEKWAPKSLAFTLGKDPEDALSYYEFNIVLLKKRSFCRAMHFSGACGNNMAQLEEIPYLYTQRVGDIIRPSLKREELTFIIPFERGKYEFDSTDIDPFLHALTIEDFVLKDITINAYSSVEGSDDINNDLQMQRANSLVEVLTSRNFAGDVAVDVNAEANWDLCFEQIKRFDELAEWRGMSKEDIIDALQDPYTRSQLEPYLAEQRNAQITLGVLIEPQDYDEDEYAIDSYLAAIAAAVGNEEDEELKLDLIYEAEILQSFLFKAATDDRVMWTDIVMADIPMDPDYLSLLTNQLYVEAVYLRSRDEEDQDNLYRRFKALANISVLNDTARYNHLAALMNLWKGELYDDEYSLGDIEAYIEQLGVSKIDKENIDKLRLAYYFKAAQYYKTDKRKRKELQEAAEYLYNTYTSEELSTDLALILAEFFVDLEMFKYANDILVPFVSKDKPDPKLYALFLKLNYIHKEEAPDNAYAEALIEAASWMKEKQWCKLFVGPCNISFQIFDYEPLRDLYCEKCGDKGNFATELTHSDKD